MSTSSRVFGIVSAALAALPAWAAIIGPTWDWKPITELAKEQGISDDMVADILAAGLNLYCPGTAIGNQVTLNAWMLSSDGLITTNAHAFYDERGRLRAPISECYVQSLADVLDSIDHTNPITKVFVDPSSVSVGTTSPYQDIGNFRHDRATFRLVSRLPQMRPLPPPETRPVLVAGQEIFEVSRKPKSVRESDADKSPMMFHTTIGWLDGPFDGLPGIIRSDVDGILGTSAGLILIRDPSDPSRLIPVAINSGSNDTMDGSGAIIDHLEWSMSSNSAFAIVIDDYFYANLEALK